MVRPPVSDPAYDIEFFWDPVCPFSWITSRWVEQVARQRDDAVDWRFISLRLLNKTKDYATEFPSDYEHGHTAGLRMLRVAAAVRDELGREPLARSSTPTVAATGTGRRAPA
jgi:predicted DsbA family dithiol-disulfide isomerase